MSRWVRQGHQGCLHPSNTSSTVFGDVSGRYVSNTDADTDTAAISLTSTKAVAAAAAAAAAAAVIEEEEAIFGKGVTE